MKLIFYIVVAFVLVSETRADDEAEQLVAKALERTHAVTSGKFVYKMATSQPELNREYLYIFDPGRWLQGPIAMHNVRRLHRDGYNVEWGGTSVRLLDTNAKMTFSGPQIIPTFAGSLWPEEMRWITNHITWFKYMGTETVDTFKTHVCEAPVSHQFDSRPSQIPTIAPPSNSTIRLYVAPVLGYAVPLVEHYTDGQLRERYTATDFSEKAPGIFFASHIRHETAREKDATLVLDNCYLDDFEVRAEHVNAMLPDSALSFVLPAGGRINDRINNTFFKLRDDTDARDLLEIGRKAVKRPQKQQKVPIGLTD